LSCDVKEPTDGQKAKDYPLKPGESFGTGYCPSCQKNVGVKIVGEGYHPGCLSMLFHFVMILITLGAWLGVLGGIAIYFTFVNKGNRYCLECGRILRQE